MKLLGINVFKKTVILLSFIATFLNAQNCLENSSIEETFFNDDIIGLYLSALNFDTGESNVLLFDYAIKTPVGLPLAECANNNIYNHGYKLKFDISMFIDNIMDSPVQVASGNIKLYNLASSITELRFRNTDLNAETSALQGGALFNLDDYEVNIEDQVDDLTELFVSAGRVPNGVYTFNFILEGQELDNNNNFVGSSYPIDNISKQLTIFVPTYLELISPGSSSLSDTLSTQILNQYPTFQWNTDYCSNCSFAIRVAEYKPIIHSSIYEALEDYSVLPHETGYFSVNSNINVFQYPTSGFESLMPGSYYVWQIMRSFETTNGTNEEFSEVFVFKVQSMSTGDVITEMENNDFSLENIKLLIGEPKYNQLFGESGDLYQYNLVDQTMELNDEDISINYLIQLLQKFNSSEIEIIEVEVE